MSTYQLYEILKSVDGVSEEQAREAMDGIICANDVATKDDIKDMATKTDLRDIESRMATKADIKDMATKADLKDMESRMESRMATKEDLKDLENKMLKQQAIHSGIVIAAMSLIIAISQLVT